MLFSFTVSKLAVKDPGDWSEQSRQLTKKAREYCLVYYQIFKIDLTLKEV